FWRAAVRDLFGAFVDAEEHDLARRRLEPALLEQRREAGARPSRVAHERIAAGVVVPRALEADDLLDSRALLLVGQRDLKRTVNEARQTKCVRRRIDQRRNRVMLDGEELLARREEVLERRRDAAGRGCRKIGERHDLLALGERRPVGAERDAGRQETL